MSYHVTFHFVEGLTNVPPDLVDESCGELELIDVTDTCIGWRCKATLYDAAGFVVGYVDTDGNHRLGGA